MRPRRAGRRDGGARGGAFLFSRLPAAPGRCLAAQLSEPASFNRPMLGNQEA